MRHVRPLRRAQAPHGAALSSTTQTLRRSQCINKARTPSIMNAATTMTNTQNCGSELMSALKIAINSFCHARHYHSRKSDDDRMRALDNIKHAIAAGSNPSILEKSGTPNLRTTTIIIASANEDLEVLSLLLASPLADVNVVDAESDTALLMAAKNEHPEIIGALLDAGASAKVQNADGLTPLMLAISGGCYESCSILARRASWDWRDADNFGTTLLNLAIAASKSPEMANIMHLLTSIIDERALQGSCPSPSHGLPKARSL